MHWIKFGIRGPGVVWVNQRVKPRGACLSWVAHMLSARKPRIIADAFDSGLSHYGQLTLKQGTPPRWLSSLESMCIKWVWLKTKQEGLRRFWFMCPLTRVDFSQMWSSRGRPFVPFASPPRRRWLGEVSVRQSRLGRGRCPTRLLSRRFDRRLNYGGEVM